MTIFENIALNNNIANTTSGAPKGSGSFANAKNEVLKNMAIALFEALESGDPDATLELNATVRDILQNKVTLILPDASEISGRTDALLPLSIGDNATFNVSINKTGQLTLSLVSSDTETSPEATGITQDNPLVKKTLAAANLPSNDRSRQVVSELLNAGQSVSTANIKRFLALSIRNPDIPIKELVLLDANKVPMTKENLTAFKDLSNGAAVWSEQDIYPSEKTAMSAASDVHVPSESADRTNDTTSSAMQAPEATVPLSDKSSGSQSPASIVPHRESAENGLAPSGPASAEALPSGTTPLSENNTVKNPDGQSELPADTVTLSSDAPQPEEGSEKALYGSQSEKTSVSDKPQPIEPQDFSEEAVKKFYGALKDSDAKNTAKASKEALPENQAPSSGKASEEIASKAAQDAAPATTTVKLQFMQDINNVFPFIQIPVKLQEENAKGELYVFEKKKKYNPDEPLTAVLHLELDSLGTTDIKVSMFKNKVSAHFEVASDDAISFFEEELPSLTERIEKLGFTFDTDFKVKEPDSSAKPLLYELLEAHAPQNYSRYTFDVHA